MQTGAPIDHYQPIKGGRNAPLVATYAHTTPLVPPVSIAATTKQPVVTDIVTNIKPSQQTNVTTTTATTAAAQPVVSDPLPTQYTTTSTVPLTQQATTTTTAATQPVISAPAAVQQTSTTTQQVAAVPLATQSTTTTQQQAASGSRPSQVVETIYPSAQSRTDAAAVGATAAVAGVAATQTARTQPVATQTAQTTTTQAAMVPVVAGAAGSRKGLDLDMTANSIDSYTAPTPIHLTIHPDPAEEVAASAGAADAVANANAISYLHSVHPALPATTASTGAQQPQSTSSGRSSEGAAASMNGLWTPMTTDAAQATQTQSSSYASSAPGKSGMAAGVAAGAAVGAGAAYMSELPTSSTERVRPVDDVSALSAEGRMAVPVASASVAGPLVVGETQQLGGVQRITQVDQASGLTGERIAVASTQREMPAAQTFTSSTGPQVLMVSGVPANASSQASIQSPPSPAPIHGDQVYASEAPVIPARPLEGSMVQTNPHDHQYYASTARVERDAGVAAGAATGAAMGARAAYEPLPVTSSGERIVNVDDASTLSGEGRMAVPIASVMAAGPLAVGETQQLGGVERITRVDPASSISGERLDVTMPQRTMPAGQTFTSTTGPTIMQVSDASNLLGGLRTPVVVNSATTGPQVIGETQQLGGGEAVREVEDVGRLSQGVPVPIAVVQQRELPAGHVFTSTTGPQVVHVPGTYTATIVQPTETRFTQRLETDSSVPSVVQLDDTTSLTGERLTLENAAFTRPLISSTVPVTSQFESITQVSHSSQLQGDMRTPVPVMVESVSRPLFVGQTEQMGTTVNNVEMVSEMRGERLPIASSQSTTGTLRTYELTGTTSQPQISYTFAQPTQTSVRPVYNPQSVQNVQQSVQQVETVQAVQPVVATEQRTTITREAISAEDAVAATTSVPVTAGDVTYDSLTTRQAAGLEEQYQRIDGRTHIAYVDKQRMEGRESVPVGAYGQFTKEPVDTVSSGVKDMQLDDSQQQTYTKEQI